MGWSINKPFGGKNNLLNKTIGGVGGFLFGKQGPENPFAPPDLTQLLGLDVKNRGTGSEMAFKDLLGGINAPSSVDAVRGEVEDEQMKALLLGADEDIAAARGSTKMDFLDRGLGGPGQISDIEANALATLQGKGLRAKGDIRSGYALKKLDRLAERESAVRDAYKTRYNTQTDLEESNMDRELRRLLGIAEVQSGLYNQGADRKIAGRKDGLLDRIGLNIGIGG